MSCIKKPTVNQLVKYRWSSYPSYINKTNSPDWLNRDEVYAELGNHQRYSGYQRFVEKGNDEDTRKFYMKKQLPAIWGDKHFAKIAYTQARSGSTEINKSNSVELIEINRIVQQVADYFEHSEETIVKAKRGPNSKNIPRWIAMKLSQDHSGQKLADIGKIFGVGNYCTVSQTISRLMKLAEKDKQVARDLSAISKDLTR